MCHILAVPGELTDNIPLLKFLTKIKDSLSIHICLN